MATQTGSYDFKAAKEGHDDAAKYATNYIIEKVANDVWVHSEDHGPNSSGEATTDTYGWRIGSVFELVRAGLSYIKMWVENSVAKVRVGLEAAGHVILSPSGMEVYDASAKVASFGADGAVIGQDDDMQLKLTSGSLVIEDEIGDALFSVTAIGDGDTQIAKAIYSNVSTVPIGPYTIVDQYVVSAPSGEVDVVVEARAGQTVATLSSLECHYEVVPGKTVTVEVTPSGSATFDSMVRAAGEPGTLMVYYWVSHVSKTIADLEGDMNVSGHLTSNGEDGGLYLSTTSYDSRIKPDTPSETLNKVGIHAFDVNGDRIYSSESSLNTNGLLYRSFICRRYSSDGGTAYNNGFYLEIDTNCNPIVEFTSGADTAWRNGLGATSGVWNANTLKNVGWTYAAGSASAAFYVRWCKVAHIVHVEVYGSKSIAVNTATTLSTTAIASGSTPSKEVDNPLYASSNNVGDLWVDTSGNVKCKVLGAAATSIYGSLSYPVI